MPAELAIVVVNYRTADLTVDCLRSISAEMAGLPGARAVVVDNASGDGSAERIAAAIASAGWRWASLLKLGENRGFSAGNNAGVRALRAGPDGPDWFLFLNPDTLARPGALRALLACGTAHPRAGIVGCRLESADGTPQVAAFRFHSILTELDGALRLGVVSRLLSRWALVPPQRETAGQAGWISGACMLVRRAMLEEIGLFDEGYFLYFEESDLCLRAARAGWERWQEPRSRVVHLGGQSTGFDPSNLRRRLPGYLLDSRRRYFVKNHGIAYAALADLAWIVGHLGWRLRRWLQRQPSEIAPGLLLDFVRHGALARRVTR